jgi:hypothetical protein
MAPNSATTHGASVSTLPARDATLGDMLAAVDAALIAGDVHRARRLIAFMQDLHALMRERKGGRDADEG